MKRLSMRITRPWPDAAERAAQQHFDVMTNPDDRQLTREELAKALEQFDIVCPTITDRIDAKLLRSVNPRVRALCNFGAGVNHIDLAACRAAGIIVTNTPDVLTDDTADIAMLLAMMTARRAAEGERLIRAADWTGWSPTHMMGRQFSGRTLGIVGFGRIGQAMAHRAHFGFGMRILYFARSDGAAEIASQMGARRVGLDELMTAADIISLHMPGGEATRHMIDARLIGLMQSHAILVNTARGDVIDEQALIDALRGRRIGGAGLDVFDGEPAISPDLVALDNAVLLPHLGSATLETRTAMGMRALANARAIADGSPAPDPVSPSLESA